MLARGARFAHLPGSCLKMGHSGAKPQGPSELLRGARAPAQKKRNSGCHSLLLAPRRAPLPTASNQYSARSALNMHRHVTSCA